jgi:hypothetical protein
MTLGCYTGPLVATLVIDIDEPALFKKWVDRGNSPLLAGRWRELDGCLVSVRGSVTAEDVRTGQARGKLIFHLEGDDQHSLARIAANRWKKTRGVEIFYGKGLPSVVGDHPSGEQYRLEGILGEAPAWLIEGMSPRSQGRKAAPSENGKRRGAQIEPSSNGCHEDEPTEVDTTELERLREILREIDPTLNRSSIGWRTKELQDGRIILVGRCPFNHVSGTSNDGDLSAGFNSDGIPYVYCQHATCTSTPAVDKRLKARCARIRKPAIEPPTFEPTEIAKAIVSDLESRNVAFHQAPTGAGKSYALCQAAVIRYRADQPTLIAVPTLRIAYEIRDTLLKLAPDLEEASALAMVCGHRPAGNDDLDHGEGNVDAEEEDPAEYPINEWTRTVICTHAAMGRRGFSKFIRGIWAAIGPVEKRNESRPAFPVIVDETSELIRQIRWQIDFESRYRLRKNPDGTGGTLEPLRDCPRSNWSGNCANCVLEPVGGELRFNSFGIRELGPPRAIQVDAAGTRLRKPCSPLMIDDGALIRGPRKRVGHTTFASRVISWRGKPVDGSTRRTAPIFQFRTDPRRKQHPEPAADVLAHLLEFAFLPVIIWEYAVNNNGEPIGSKDLKRQATTESRGWDHNITFPRQTCEVRRLLLADLYVLEQLRQFTKKNDVGIAFVGAALTQDDFGVLREVWPELLHRQHPYPPRKIRQAAVVFVEGKHGIGSLRDADNRLLTHALEKTGRGLIFCPTRRVAESLFKDVHFAHPSARLAVENVEQMVLQRTLHRDEKAGCFITYSRGVMGLGVNIEGLRFLVVDAQAFRAVSGFNPAEITVEAFQQTRPEERSAMIFQNIGRAVRGEAGKTVVLIILNADEDLKKAICESRALIEGAELAPVFAGGDDLVPLIDEAGRWLEANGGDWPPPNPDVEDQRHRGRPKGSRERTLDFFVAKIPAAVAAGMNWGEFTRANHPERCLNLDERSLLHEQFSSLAGRKTNGDAGEASPKNPSACARGDPGYRE